MLHAGSKMERPRCSFCDISGRRYKLWWSGNDAESGGVEILLKEEISGIVKVRKKSDKEMVIVLNFRKRIDRIYACGPQSGRPNTQKVRFYEIASEQDSGSSSKIIASSGDFNGHVGECAEGFENVDGENGIGKRNAERRRLLEFCDEKELCVANTWF